MFEYSHVGSRDETERCRTSRMPYQGDIPTESNCRVTCGYAQFVYFGYDPSFCPLPLSRTKTIGIRKLRRFLQLGYGSYSFGCFAAQASSVHVTLRPVCCHLPCHFCLPCHGDCRSKFGPVWFVSQRAGDGGAV